MYNLIDNLLTYWYITRNIMSNFKLLEVTAKTEVTDAQIPDLKKKGIKVKVDSKGKKYATLRLPLVKISPEDYEWASKERWCLNSAGYVFRWEKSSEKLKSIYLQKEILKTPPDQFVTFEDGDKLNVTRENLKALSRTQLMHRKKKKVKTETKYKGIFWLKSSSKWLVSITGKGKRIYGGSFLSEEFAAKVYDFYARKIYGKYADLNFPDIHITEEDIRNKILEERHKSSKYKGVTKMKGSDKYRVRITHKKKLYDLGAKFTSEDEANRAYEKKKEELSRAIP